MGLGGVCWRVLGASKRLVPGAALLAATGCVAANYAKLLGRARQQVAVVNQLSLELTSANAALHTRQRKVSKLEGRLQKLASNGANSKAKCRIKANRTRSKLHLARCKLRATADRAEVLAADLQHKARQLQVAKACILHLLDQLEQEQKQSQQRHIHLQQSLASAQAKELQLSQELRTSRDELQQKSTRLAMAAGYVVAGLRQDLAQARAGYEEVLAASTDTSSQLRECRHQLQELSQQLHAEKSATQAERLQADHLHQELTAALQASNNWRNAFNAANEQLQQFASSLEACKADNGALIGQLVELRNEYDKLKRTLDHQPVAPIKHENEVVPNQESVQVLLPGPATTTHCNTPRRADSGALPSSRRRVLSNSSSSSNSSSDDDNGAPCCSPSSSSQDEIEEHDSTFHTYSTSTASTTSPAKPHVGSSLPVPELNLAACTQDAALDVVCTSPTTLCPISFNSSGSSFNRRRSSRDNMVNNGNNTNTCGECQELGTVCTQCANSRTDEAVENYTSMLQELHTYDGVSFRAPSQASLASAAPTSPNTNVSQRPAGVPALNLRPAEDYVLLGEEVAKDELSGALAGLLRATGCHSARWKKVKAAVERTEAACEHHSSAGGKVEAVDKVVMRLQKAKQQGLGAAGTAPALSHRLSGYSRLLVSQGHEPTQLLEQDDLTYCLAAAVYGLGGPHLHPSVMQAVEQQLRAGYGSCNNADTLFDVISHIADAFRAAGLSGSGSG